MQKELLKMAEGFSVVVEALTAIANENSSGNQAETAGKKQPGSVKEKDTKNPENASNKADDNFQNTGIEDIRAVLAEKSQDGKSKEVKALLNQYGVAKLSAVEEKDYPELLQKARAL